uniref:Uncharacterized protein n=1 Tax=Anguilla anguilla TaxID=7936 RepID=A0A0E9QX42_ANGAN
MQLYTLKVFLFYVYIRYINRVHDRPFTKTDIHTIHLSESWSSVFLVYSPDNFVFNNYFFLFCMGNV